MEISEEDRDRYGFFRPTDEVFQAWEATKRIAETLRARIVVFQCPASFDPTDEHKRNMRAFFGEVDRGDLTFAWEPRGEWKDGEDVGSGFEIPQWEQVNGGSVLLTLSSGTLCSGSGRVAPATVEI